MFKTIRQIVPQIILAFVGLVLIAIFLPILGPTRITATGSNPINVNCQGTNNRGLLIVHQFPDEGAFNNCKNDPNCGPQLVGQPSDPHVCPSGNNYIGTTTNPRDGLPTTCSDLGNCSDGHCSSTAPNCSVVQIDCLNGLGGGINAGGLTFFGNCSTPPTHKECVNNACTTVSGAGADNCPNNCQPETHKICKNNACATVPITEQGTACNQDVDCQPQNHQICKNMACATVPISEQGTVCTQDSQCFHTSCQSSTPYSCVKVDGGGNNQCRLNSADCQPQTHKVCQNLTCAVVSGPGQNTCNSDNDCQPVTHKECRNNACATITGPGQSVCNVDADCVPVTHKECRSNACATVTGAGTNSCNVDSDCVPQTHRECRNNACTVVSGSGSNQCNVDGDCTVASHYECRNNACTSVSGSGASTCSSNNDCVPATQYSVCDSLNVSPQSGNTPLTVTSTLSGHTVNGGSINNYKFNFGDATGDFSQGGQVLSHTFQSAGNYIVRGYVKDNLGNETGGNVNCQKIVTVYQPQVLGVSTPPVIPNTGAETSILFGLIGSGTIGYLLRKLKLS